MEGNASATSLAVTTATETDASRYQQLGNESPEKGKTFIRTLFLNAATTTESYIQSSFEQARPRKKIIDLQGANYKSQ